MRTLVSSLAAVRRLTIYAVALLAPIVATAQTLPDASQVASQIQAGWNLGNTLEAQCGETAWGNPMVNQQLVNAVKAAGFNAIRIPAAWDCHANQTTMTIDAAWITRECMSF
jgi:endoglucanase